MKIGDTVRFLNTTGGGRVVRIEGNIAHVEDADGFEIPMLVKECVVVDPGLNPKTNTRTHSSAPKVTSSPAPITPATTAPAPKPAAPVAEELPYETPEGDLLNIVLGYEPEDIRRLGTTSFDAYLVNDSNYYLYFTYMTRPDRQSGWTTRYAGIVEPNIQVYIDTIVPENLASIGEIAVQYIPFKQDKEFALKNPALVQYSFDATRFFKLHCFHDNPYFDSQVIAYDIVKDDRPQRQRDIDTAGLEKAMKQKKAVDRRPVVKRQLKKADKKNGEIIEVDLHIDELIDNTAGLGAADMLNLQIDEFRRVMDENLNKHGQRIVFIHGKGEGVLRKAIMKELSNRYKGHQVQDASFQEYGYGATQVTI